jgi:hypothetical protein
MAKGTGARSSGAAAAVKKALTAKEPAAKRAKTLEDTAARAIYDNMRGWDEDTTYVRKVVCKGIATCLGEGALWVGGGVCLFILFINGLLLETTIQICFCLPIYLFWKIKEVSGFHCWCVVYAFTVWIYIYIYIYYMCITVCFP